MGFSAEQILRDVTGVPRYISGRAYVTKDGAIAAMQAYAEMKEKDNTKSNPANIDDKIHSEQECKNIAYKAFADGFDESSEELKRKFESWWISRSK